MVFVKPVSVDVTPSVERGGMITGDGAPKFLFVGEMRRRFRRGTDELDSVGDVLDAYHDGVTGCVVPAERDTHQNVQRRFQSREGYVEPPQLGQDRMIALWGTDQPLMALRRFSRLGHD